MPHPYRKILPGNSPGTIDKFGGNDYNLLTLWHEDVDLTTGSYVENPYPSRVATPTEFRTNRLRLLNPARTHIIKIVTLDFEEDYNLTIPLMQADDEFMLLALDQVIYNKTISLEDNTVTSNAINLGDLIGSNGSKYVRVPIGLPGQVLTVKSDGLAWEWADPVVVGGGGIPDDNSVTTVKIVNSAVTNDKLAGSIAGSKLLDDAITTAKIANLQVTSSKIADLTITAGKIANGTITSTQIGDAQITNAKLAGSITDSKLLQITDKAKLPSDILYTATALPAPTGGRYGAFHGSDISSAGGGGGTAPYGEGILTGNVTNTGTISAGADSHLYGPYAVHTSAASSNSNAALRSIREIGSRGINLEMVAKIRVNDTSTANLWVGFKNANTVGTSTFTNALDSSHGAFIGFNQSDTNFMKVANDGTASASSSQFHTSAIAKTALTGWHILSVKLNNSTSGNNVVFGLRNTSNQTEITQSVNTTMPATTQKLYMHTTYQTKAASARVLEVAYVYVKIADASVY